MLVDVPLAHLDRPFDYLVPERLSESAVPGCRVRVRFAGQLTGGYLLNRAGVSEHPGRLTTLERVVSPEPVLTPEIAALARFSRYPPVSWPANRTRTRQPGTADSDRRSGTR